MNKVKNKEFFNVSGWRLWRPLKSNGCISLLFLLLICLPLANQVFKIVKPYELVEKRQLAEKPTFDSRHPFLYVKRYEAYYNDQFSFRTRLVHLNSLLTYKIFHTSASDKVLIGKQGWLFLGNIDKYFNEVDYYRNLKPFTAEELLYWQTILEQRRNWLKRRGIHYLFTIAPNKSTIYPEFMPDAIRKINSQSRQDQLIEHLKKYSTLSILDLRPALLQAKKWKMIYDKTDTHWNDLGGYIAYSEIIRHLKQYYDFINPRPVTDFLIKQKEFRMGDLALMLSLPNIFWENQWQMKAKIPLRARTVPDSDTNSRNKWVTISVHKCATGPLPAAMMVHDSFAHQMKQFLSEDFSKIVYVWDWSLNFFDKIIKQEGIKIVIDEMVEYSLLNRFPSNPRKLRR
jgi:alginate O-acetyltransferase complex protein AlgJ